MRALKHFLEFNIKMLLSFFVEDSEVLVHHLAVRLLLFLYFLLLLELNVLALNQVQHFLLFHFVGVFLLLQLLGVLLY